MQRYMALLGHAPHTVFIPKRERERERERAKDVCKRVFEYIHIQERVYLREYSTTYIERVFEYMNTFTEYSHTTKRPTNTKTLTNKPHTHIASFFLYMTMYWYL